MLMPLRDWWAPGTRADLADSCLVQGSRRPLRDLRAPGTRAGLGAGHCAQAFCPFETYGRQEPVRPWEMVAALKLCPFETDGRREPVRAWG